MGWLERLPEQARENIQTPEAAPSKPSKPSYEGFEGAQVGKYIFSRANLWSLHYPDRQPTEVFCTPAVTHEQVLADNPDAIAAEPVLGRVDSCAVELPADQETAIRGWLAQIGETDPAAIAEVLDRCRSDLEARHYFLERSGYQPAAVHSCATCRHRKRPGRADYRACGGGHDDLERVYGEHHPLRVLPADGGLSCDRWEALP